MLALHYYRGEWVGGLEGWGSCKLRMWLVRNRNTEIPKRAMGEAHANAKIENKTKLENLLRCLFRKLAHSLLCRDGAPGCRSPLADRRASQPFQYSWWTTLFHFVPNMRTYWTDQNATLPLTRRLKALWGRDRFWKPAPPLPSLLPHWTSEAAVKMVSSFHQPYHTIPLVSSSHQPLSSPSLHQFSYCRHGVPGWHTGAPQTPQNTSKTPQEYISNISDHSPCCGSLS